MPDECPTCKSKEKKCYKCGKSFSNNREKEECTNCFKNESSSSEKKKPDKDECSNCVFKNKSSSSKEKKNSDAGGIEEYSNCIQDKSSNTTKMKTEAPITNQNKGKCVKCVKPVITDDQSGEKCTNCVKEALGIEDKEECSNCIGSSSNGRILDDLENSQIILEDNQKRKYVIETLKKLISPGSGRKHGIELSKNIPDIDDLALPEKLEIEIENCRDTARKCDAIPIHELKKALNSAKTIEVNHTFQGFNPVHKGAVKHLIRILNLVKVEYLPIIADYAYQVLNISVFRYALTISLIHRPDIIRIRIAIPSQITLQPQLYFSLSGFLDDHVKYDVEAKTLTILALFEYDDKQTDVDQRLEYFRCDPGVNCHHRHWHEAYPDEGVHDNGKIIDRMGEIFYYMHNQMVARYNFERLSVGLGFVEPLHNFRDPIPEPYFNKLDMPSKIKLWDSRPPNTAMQDTNTYGINLRVQDLERWRDRIFEAIDRGVVYKRNEDGSETVENLNEGQDDQHGIPLDNGINKLAYMFISSNIMSCNHKLYGNLHNMGHMMIGLCHDPVGVYFKRSHPGAMCMTETSIRDPAFFRWHMFVDDVFNKYKATLPEYSEAELNFPDVSIVSVRLENQEEDEIIFKTRWTTDTVDITDGIPDDKKELFNAENVYYEFSHLTHQDFTYEITVINHTKHLKKGVVRIFLIPSFKDHQLHDRLYRQGTVAMEYEKKRNPLFEPYFNKQRRMAIELDKFLTDIPPNESIIRRSSSNSSVTIPAKQLFMNLNDSINFIEEPEKSPHYMDSAWCGCGWPDYLLIGKGNEEGLKCHVFVHITDYKKDKVKGTNMTECKLCCKESMSFCGIRDKMYPDRKPMGFPFDRNVAQKDALLSDFLLKKRNDETSSESSEEDHEQSFCNMKLTPAKVIFENIFDPFPGQNENKEILTPGLPPYQEGLGFAENTPDEI